MKTFVHSIQKPRCAQGCSRAVAWGSLAAHTTLALPCRAVIILVKAGAPVDETIAGLIEHMEPGDIIIDGGNEWWDPKQRVELEGHRDIDGREFNALRSFVHCTASGHAPGSWRL